MPSVLIMQPQGCSIDGNVLVTSLGVLQEMWGVGH